jgi:hypothetical protein
MRESSWGALAGQTSAAKRLLACVSAQPRNVRTLRRFHLLTLPAAALLLAGCGHEVAVTSGPMPQRGYLWQRHWTPAVAEAFRESQKRLDGVVVLGGEVVWKDGQPRLVSATVDWSELARAEKSCAIALRVAPFGGRFAEDDANSRFIAETAKSFVNEAQKHGVTLTELQLDFDAAQKKLAGYRFWLKRVRAAIAPVPLVITTLPAWLEEREFSTLLSEVDSFVLQVHSVPAAGELHRTICDPALARRWVARAAKLRRPFVVALPTYRCLAGYAPDGRLLGVAMDAGQPSWPAGTRVVEFAANPEELAGLVQEWTNRRPADLQALIWYRVPVETDVRNWRWPTLSAVMRGRAPARRLEVITTGENPIDLVVTNKGEADEQLTAPVVVTWQNAALTASDALPGWTLQISGRSATFTPEPQQSRLAPGQQRGIGWLRYDRPTSPAAEIGDNSAAAGR